MYTQARERQLKEIVVKMLDLPLQIWPPAIYCHIMTLG